MDINWVRTIKEDGKGWHVGSMVHWKGKYYISYCDGVGHNSPDTQVGILSSTDLEQWTSQIALGQDVTGMYAAEPQLLPIGDRLYLYTITSKLDLTPEFGPPSWQVTSFTEDGETWSEPKRGWAMDHDFWHPIEHKGRYYATCDNAGHVPTGIHAKVDLLTSEDGERWSWVSEVLHGSDEADLYDAAHDEYFSTPMPSECALCFLEDERLLAVARARGHTAVLSIAEPPDYDSWVHRRSKESRCYGADIKQVGEHYVITGRSFDNEGTRVLTDNFKEEGIQCGVFLYEEGDLRLQVLLPGGGDTGYASILPLSDSEAAIAYYSSWEYEKASGSNVYLASVSVP